MCRSLTILCDVLVVGDEPQVQEIAVLYRQEDGDPRRHGVELARFLHELKMVNGIGADDPPYVACGPDCLAAQVVAHFKRRPGGFYLMPAGTREVGEEYRYFVLASDEEIRLRIEDEERQLVFKGSPADVLHRYADGSVYTDVAPQMVAPASNGHLAPWER